MEVIKILWYLVAAVVFGGGFLAMWLVAKLIGKPKQTAHTYQQKHLTARPVASIIDPS